MRPRHHQSGWIGVVGLAELSPAVLSAFIAKRSGARLAKTTVRSGCGVLRVFLRYAHRQGPVATELSRAVEWAPAYRLADIPRSISWAEAGLVLGSVDRRTACGKRDYAILLLLVTYGLRAREVAALTLDDIDWKRDRLAIPGRKAGHSTAFPLSAVVGEALVDYLRHGRPPSGGRRVFFRRWRRCGRSAGSRSPRAPGTTCSRPGSRCPRGVAPAAAHLRAAAGKARNCIRCNIRARRDDGAVGDAGPRKAASASWRRCRLSCDELIVLPLAAEMGSGPSRADAPLW
jgi:integrase